MRSGDQPSRTSGAADLARKINPIVRGWVNYYGAFYKSALFPLLERINAYLMRWMRKVQTAAGTQESPGCLEPSRRTTARVLRPLGLDHPRPPGLVTRTTRAV
ncbi:group II intron maturase-specific domain-containing protein [Streptomyces sp. NPDC001276]|uniref:group II intron maturase-specific domain-containing protein n=1 Tax=Streptomyces sp. NPDC001276 TaxID=3364555 RepID=UPI003673BA76